MTGISASKDVGTVYAGWTIGTLEIEGLSPRDGGPALDAEVDRVEEMLRSRFGGLGRKAIALTEPTRIYEEHFSRSGKAYPVLLQAAGVVSKGRRIAMPDPLVRAMFAAELEGMLLTAGHDLDALAMPLSLGLASGSATMPTLGGDEKAPPADDLVMSDARGIVASVLLGPDARTCITAATRRALFVIYAPATLPDRPILDQLERLGALALLACPGAKAGTPALMKL
jgi:hypothetical protein